MLKHLLLVVIAVCTVDLLQNLLLLHIVLPNGRNTGNIRYDIHSASSLVAIVNKILRQQRRIIVVVLIIVFLNDWNQVTLGRQKVPAHVNMRGTGRGFLVLVPSS